MLSILIVDDDLEIQSLLKLYLDFFKYKIIGLANNGIECIKLYKKYKNKIDFILMDYKMPRMNGFEAMKELLKINPEIKIVIMSADSS